VKAQAERMAINAPIQGTEADIIKLAMIQVGEYLRQNGFENDTFLLLQVHDELVYEIRRDKVEHISKEIKRIMESIIDPKDTKGIVMVAESHGGRDWGELK